MQKEWLLLEKKIGYRFREKQNLKLALTHRSKGSHNYERLEFLGDSILGFVIADYLYQQFTHLTEGQLSRMRSQLVRKETLAKLSKILQVGDFLLLGQGELKSGGFERDSILADAFESIIGAIYLDSDFDTVRKYILRQYANILQELSQDMHYKDAKSRLQEWLQKRTLSLPEYQLISESGQAHQQIFEVSCHSHALDIMCQASASSKKIAEQKAAAKVLGKIAEMA